jgi:hypothetical protein
MTCFVRKICSNGAINAAHVDVWQPFAASSLYSYWQVATSGLVLPIGGAGG